MTDSKINFSESEWKEFLTEFKKEQGLFIVVLVILISCVVILFGKS